MIVTGLPNATERVASPRPGMRYRTFSCGIPAGKTASAGPTAGPVGFHSGPRSSSHTRTRGTSTRSTMRPQSTMYAVQS
jgi:hypothetical protein